MPAAEQVPRKVALLFRYGLAEHVDFLPALPFLARRLREKGVEVEHFGFRGPRAAPAELAACVGERVVGPRVDRSNLWDKHRMAALWMAGLPALGRRLWREGFDTVFVDETLPLTAPLLRRSFPGRLAFTVHDFFADIYLVPNPLLRPLGCWMKAADLRAWRRLDRIFTRVSAARDFLVAGGVPSERLRVVHDGVDLELFRPGDRAMARRRFGFGAEDLVLTHHGILHPNKGNLRILEAFARVAPREPRLRLLLIGDGPEMPGLRRRLRELPCADRVRLTGWLPGLPDIAEALHASDIGLVMRLGMPGDDFHVTSTLVHNLASGLPVLAARLRGIQEVLEEEREGLLFDPSCGPEWEEKLLRLCRDPELRDRMGRQARLRAESTFDPEQIARAYAEGLGVG